LTLSLKELRCITPPDQGRHRWRSTDGAGCGSCGPGSQPGAQAAWASSRPARVRTARCSLHWRRGGSSRLHPVIPGSAAQGESRLKLRSRVWSAERRACPRLGPPPQAGEEKRQGRAAAAALRFFREEKAKRTMRHPCWCACRRSASLFAEALEGLSCAWLGHDSDAEASRERDCFCTSPRVRGEIERSEGEGALPRV
jgi:hypothetical protein